MRLAEEAIFVGVYCVGLYLTLYFLFGKLFPTVTLSVFRQNVFVFLFVLGFLKHFMGYYLGLHTYYCENPDSTGYLQNKNIFIQPVDSVPFVSKLFMASFFEGLLFIGMGWFFFDVLRASNHPELSIFCIGVLLHIFSDIIGGHHYFCQHFMP
jgi:hypothetical protein